jgi:hypothetical protein
MNSCERSKIIPIKYGLIDVLTDDEVSKSINIIENLFDYWVKRESPESDVYTLGATLYQDLRHPAGLIYYVHNARKTNPVLLKNFSWLYEIVLNKLTIEFGEKFELSDGIGFPGFQIFGHAPGKLNSDFTVQVMQTPIAGIHFDAQYMDLIKYWKANFQDDYDLKNPMSFTLALELPKNGGAMSTWGVDDYERNSEYERYLKNLNYSKHEYGYLGPPNVVPYTPGKMFYFVGDMLHQIAPAYKMDYDDRRITLQGHAIKCKGVWRTYF